MRHRKAAACVRIAMIALMVLACAGGLRAQNAQVRTGILRGQVADSSGGSVANASVQVTTPAGQLLTRTTDANGAFEVTDLAPGNYHLAVTVAGFAPNEQGVQIVAGQVQQLTVSLAVAVQQQELTVSEIAPTVDASPSNNASAVVMSGTDLEAFSDDPDQLQADLQALAGPAAGPAGGQIFIDGFSGGQLPPKSSIREIRINSNPFSAEYDQMGFGRIEVLTRPGTDALHGRFAVLGNASFLNTKSPFADAANQVAYHSINYDGNITGSLRRVASFAFTAFRRNINDSAIVDAIVLDPSFNPVPFNAGIANPQTLTNLSPRVDYQINRNNTLTTRYQYVRSARENVGVGGFALPSQGDDAQATEHLLQVSETRIIGERAVNETRFQYLHSQSSQQAQNSAPTIRVTGAFTGGGSNRGISVTETDRYELQNYTSLIAGPHLFKFGGRLRASHMVNDSTNNFNGTFTFPSITAYQLTEQGLQQGLTMAQIRANGGGPNQFSITDGTPRASVSAIDAGLYVQDDWKLRPNVTLSGGLRFETQNNIPDHADIAPRIGVAWAIGSSSRPTVIRAGFGMFYNRFPEGNVLQLTRFDGVTQQQYIVTSPDFYPTIPPLTALTGSQTLPTVYSIAPNLRSAYTMQGVVTVERQITRIANVSVSYQSYRAVHRVLTNSINAPLPGSIITSNPNGTRPFGDVGNNYQYQSASDYRGNFLSANLNVRSGAKLTIFGYYGLGYAQANAVPGLGGFTSNPYNLSQDYGRPTGQTRHFLNVGGTMALPYAMRLSAFITAQSAPPFNITLGTDLNGDSILNDRPSFATSQTPPQNLVATPYGDFDTAPAVGVTPIPINYGLGTSRVSVNLNLGKTFAFGGVAARPPAAGGAGAPGGAGGPARGPQRYSLTFSVNARNVFNKVNLGIPVGNLTSPLFGTANSLAGGPFTTGAAVRRVDLQLVFAF